jgi:hypothetical protein
MTYESGYRVNTLGKGVVEGLLSAGKVTTGVIIAGTGAKGTRGGRGTGSKGVPTGKIPVVLRVFFLALLRRLFTLALSFDFLDFLLPPLRKL